MGATELVAVLAAGVTLGGFWAAFLRPRTPPRVEGGERDPLDRGSPLPGWLMPLYPLLWPVLRSLERSRPARGSLPERIARSGYTPYATVSAVWADRLQGMALGLLGMAGGVSLSGLLLGTPLVGLLAGLAGSVYGLIAPDLKLYGVIQDRKRRFRANMLLVLASARGFLRGGRPLDEALSRAAVGEGVFANWVRFLIARHHSAGVAALAEGRLHAPDPDDPYLVRFLDAVRLAWGGGAGAEAILEGLVTDLATEMEQEVSETVTAAEPLVLGAGILAIAGYVLAILLPVFIGSQAFLGF